MIKITSSFTYNCSPILNAECYGSVSIKGEVYEYKGNGTRKEAKFAAKQFARQNNINEYCNIDKFTFTPIKKQTEALVFFSNGYELFSKKVPSVKNTAISLYNTPQSYSNHEDCNTITPIFDSLTPKIENNKLVLKKYDELEFEEIITNENEKITLEEFIYPPHYERKDQKEIDLLNQQRIERDLSRHRKKETIKKCIISLNKLPKLKQPLNLNEFQKYKNFNKKRLKFLLKQSSSDFCGLINIESGNKLPSNRKLLPTNIELAEKLVNLFYFIVNKKIDYNKFNYHDFSNIISQLAGDFATEELLRLNAHPKTNIDKFPNFSFGMRCYFFIESSLKYIDVKDKNHGILVRNLIKILEKSIKKEFNSDSIEKISKDSYQKACDEYQDTLGHYPVDKKIEQKRQDLEKIAPIYLLQRLKELEMK